MAHRFWRRKLRSLSRNRTLRGFYRLCWERAYGISCKDFFLVSYPRSGNTWVRFMLLQASPDFDNDDFGKIEEIIPDMHDARPWFRCARTNVVKSHLCHWQPFRRVVYLVRDGRAATWSNWRYQRDEGVFHGTFADFLKQPTWPSTWSEHVSGWIAAPETRLVVRYEDLLANPVAELAKITGFLGWNCSFEKLQRIVDDSSRERMEALEKTSKVRLHRVGSGRISWREEFTKDLEKSFLDALPLPLHTFLQTPPL
jgi:hypothetical protein